MIYEDEGSEKETETRICIRKTALGNMRKLLTNMSVSKGILSRSLASFV